jgi:PAS domain S-box-containing protein
VLGKNTFQIVAHDVSARLREQTLVAQRTAELVALSDLTRATAGGGDLIDMLKRALPDAMSALEMPIGGIYLREGQSPNLRLVAHVGFEPGTLALYPPVLPIAAAHRGHATDLSLLVRIIDEPANLDGGFQTSLQVPLVSSNNIMGLVVFTETKPRTFLAADIRLMDIIGRQLEVGVENVRLVAELEDLVQERTSALLASEVRYKSLIEQVPGVVYTASAICTGLTFISSAADELFGLSPAEMLQSQEALLSRVNADDLDWVRLAASQATAENREFDAQYRIVDARTGSDRWVHHCARRVKMTNEDSAFWLGLLTDVTRLKELDNLKNQFVATVSHELRTPLSVIKLRATTLENYYDRLSDQARLDMVRRISHQSDILTDLIEDTLRLARLDSGNAERQLDNVDVVGIGADVVEELFPSAQSNGLKFEATWAPGDCIVCADAADVARIWRNLIGNAIKYTTAPGRVSVWAASVALDPEGHVAESALPAERLVMPPDLKPGNWVVGIVEDTGRGISEQDQKHIFTRFFRGEAALTNIPGSGLGLSLVKEVLGEYSGRVALRSRSGQGSTFVFWLPAANVAREMR